jgi:hypothetical protein
LLLLTLLIAPPSADAQAPNPPAPPNVAPPHPTPDPQATPSAPITLTGCLQRPQAAAQGQEGVTRTTPASAFVLRTLGVDGKPAAAYHLVAANQDLDLAKHLNHRVEITGTLRASTNQQPGMPRHGAPPAATDPQTPPSSSQAEGRGAEAASGTKAHQPMTQPLFVTSVKMIDAQCTAPTE